MTNCVHETAQCSGTCDQGKTRMWWCSHCGAFGYGPRAGVRGLVVWAMPKLTMVNGAESTPNPEDQQ